MTVYYIYWVASIYTSWSQEPPEKMVRRKSTHEGMTVLGRLIAHFNRLVPLYYEDDLGIST